MAKKKKKKRTPKWYTAYQIRFSNPVTSSRKKYVWVPRDRCKLESYQDSLGKQRRRVTATYLDRSIPFRLTKTVPLDFVLHPAKKKTAKAGECVCKSEVVFLQGCQCGGN